MRFSRSTHPLLSATQPILGDFNVHHKDWLTYSGGAYRRGELCYNFFISNDLTQMFVFPTRISDCDSRILALLYLFLYSDTSICSARAFLPLGNSDHDSIKLKTGCPVSSYSL